MYRATAAASSRSEIKVSGSSTRGGTGMGSRMGRAKATVLSATSVRRRQSETRHKDKPSNDFLVKARALRIVTTNLPLRTHNSETLSEKGVSPFFKKTVSPRVMIAGRCSREISGSGSRQPFQERLHRVCVPLAATLAPDALFVEGVSDPLIGQTGIPQFLHFLDDR